MKHSFARWALPLCMAATWGCTTTNPADDALGSHAEADVLIERILELYRAFDFDAGAEATNHGGLLEEGRALPGAGPGAGAEVQQGH